MKKNKAAKLISMTAATILIALILASSLYYSGGNITANVIAEDSSGFIAPSIREIDFNELKYLNEGWYEIRNSYVFYLETFDSYIPLNLKVKNPQDLNGLVVVDGNGKIEFTQKEAELPETQDAIGPESNNLITGDVTGLEPISGMQAAAINDKANDLKDKLYEEERKEASREKYRKFFADVERVFTQFRGLRYYATLFMDDKDLLRWRQDVDEAFSKLYLGSEYWTSEICEKDIEGKSEGVAYAETPQGLAQIAAHIEATRTQPIENLSKEITYIYKITFNVRNGDYENDLRAPENMTFNAIIVKESDSLESSPSSNNFIPLFKRNIHLGRGETFGRMGSTAIVKETKNQYNAVCLIFKQIPLKWKLDEKKKITINWIAEDGSQKYSGVWWTLCNKIPMSSGEPTALPRQGAAVPQGSDAELNDF